MIGQQAWELIDFRANKTGVDLVKTYGVQPPGVNYTTNSVVSVRKPT